MSFLMYMVMQMAASLWQYRGFIIATYLLGGLVCIYCLII